MAALDYFALLHARHTPDALRIDVGGNVGGHTRLLRANGPGWIVVFEPMPALAAQIAATFAEDPEIVVVPCALGDQVTTLQDLTIVGAWTLTTPTQAKLGPSLGALAQAGLTPEDRFSVPVRTLDTFLHATGTTSRVSVIKIDVDGFEPAVLRGGLTTILRDRPPILCEVSAYIAHLGHDVPSFLDLIYDGMNYLVLTNVGGETLENVPRSWWDTHYPWHSSFDVLLWPRGREAWGTPTTPITLTGVDADAVYVLDHA